RDGELISLSSQFVPQPAQTAGRRQTARAARPPATAPALPVEQAIAAAAASIGEDAPAVPLAAPAVAEGRERRTVSAAGGDRGAAQASLVWMPLNSKSARLCWRVVVPGRSGNLYQVLINAENGRPEVQTCWTASLSPASYRVFASD